MYFFFFSLLNLQINSKYLLTLKSERIKSIIFSHIINARVCVCLCAMNDKNWNELRCEIACKLCAAAAECAKNEDDERNLCNFSSLTCMSFKARTWKRAIREWNWELNIADHMQKREDKKNQWMGKKFSTNSMQKLELKSV